MSNPSKSLSYLTSSLSLSSISHTSRGYVIRRAGGLVVVTHRRAASTGPRRPTPSAAGGSGSGPSGREERRLLRTSAGTGSDTRGQAFASPSPAFFDASTGGKHSFHSSAYASHQQPLSSHPTPAEAPPQFTSSPSSPKSSSSTLSPTTEGSLLLTPHHNPTNGPSLATSTDASGSTSQPPYSNSNPTNSDRATLFTSNSAASFPHHSLPSFFGTTLSIARRSNLVFRNGAYGIPKAKLGDDGGRSAKGKEKLITSRETSEPEHALSVGIGEDAYFLRTDSLGVADGVGGWSGHAGANPARWSRKFMHHCSAELGRYENVEDELFLQYYEIDPVDVLQRAFEKTLAECKDEGVIGSSTALLAVLRNDELRLANMGDCCCSIIRGNDYVFRSEEQQHSFNYPFQAGTTSKDTPIKDAQRFTIKVQKDDIVILSSDGLCDNLFTDDVLEEVLRFVAESPPPTTTATPTRPGSRYTLNRFSPQAVSEALCHRAKSVYEDQRAVSSPFALRAMEEGIHFAGGKRDDITTLIGVVGELEASPVSSDLASICLREWGGN
ncbi:protein phosphatase PTC7, partial [Phenoliferia sp. Uapishka_3]